MSNADGAVRLIHAHPRFRNLGERLLRANIVPKKWYHFFPLPIFHRNFMHYSTTWMNTIYLSNEFDRIRIHDKAQNLCHEAIHLFQWDRFGLSGMTTRYLQSKGRLELEKEAYAKSLEWLVWNGEINNPKQTSEPYESVRANAYVNAFVIDLLEGYFLSMDKEALRGELFDWAYECVLKFWSERLAS